MSLVNHWYYRVSSQAGLETWRLVKQWNNSSVRSSVIMFKFLLSFLCMIVPCIGCLLWTESSGTVLVYQKLDTVPPTSQTSLKKLGLQNWYRPITVPESPKDRCNHLKIEFQRTAVARRLAPTPVDSGGSPSGAYTSWQRWLAVSRLHQWTAVARRLAPTPVDSRGSPSGAYTRRCDINIAELPSTPGGPQWESICEDN